MIFHGARPPFHQWLRLWAEDLFEEQLAISTRLEIPPQSRLVKALWDKLPTELRSSVVLRKAFGFRPAAEGRSVWTGPKTDPVNKGGCDYPYTYSVTKNGKIVAKTFDDTLPDYFDMPLAVSNKELARRAMKVRPPASYANITRPVAKKEKGVSHAKRKV